MVLRRVTTPQRDVIARLARREFVDIDTEMAFRFRDVYDHLQRLHATIEGIREMLATAIQVNLGMISLNETEVTKKLAAWAAIIAVPTMIAGVYGMNFKHMPELEWELGYPLAMLAMIGIDVWL
jgi:magnesium transporter